MNPVNFPEANTNLSAPKDVDEKQCLTIRGYTGIVRGGSWDGAAIVVTAWQPTQEELQDLNEGKPIMPFIHRRLPSPFSHHHVSTSHTPTMINLNQVTFEQVAGDGSISITGGLRIGRTLTFNPRREKTDRQGEIQQQIKHDIWYVAYGEVHRQMAQIAVKCIMAAQADKRNEVADLFQAAFEALKFPGISSVPKFLESNGVDERTQLQNCQAQCHKLCEEIERLPGHTDLSISASNLSQEIQKKLHPEFYK